MLDRILEKTERWLLPTVLILFILLALLTPLALQYTYAGRSETPTRVLTYTMNRLRWNRSALGIRPDGSAVLGLFSDEYDGTVLSADGENVVAPGTAKSSIVRLENDVSGPVNFVAVLYEIKTDPNLPVTVDFVGNYTDTSRYPLPRGINRDQVIRAVRGTLPGRRHRDFDIAWEWLFEVSDGQDVVDTAFGDAIPLDEITVGLYIVVEDGNDYSLPKTGDETPIDIYVTVMAVSFVLLMILLWCRKREKEEQNEATFENPANPGADPAVGDPGLQPVSDRSEDDSAPE